MQSSLTHPNVRARVLIGAGIAALVLAAALVGYNLRFSGAAGEGAQDILASVQAQMPYERTQFMEAMPNQQLSAVQVGDASFVGIIELVDLGISLPVQASWSVQAIATSPGVYAGTPYDGTLVIGGGNFDSHFGHLMEIPDGGEVVFTDMMGREFRYNVISGEVVNSNDLDKLTDYNDTWVLTLFTDSYSTTMQQVLRCKAQVIPAN